MGGQKRGYSFHSKIQKGEPKIPFKKYIELIINTTYHSIRARQFSVFLVIWHVRYSKLIH
jgi:hypothetical protein